MWVQSVQRFAVAILKLLYAVSVTYNKEILIIPFQLKVTWWYAR